MFLILLMRVFTLSYLVETLTSGISGDAVIIIDNVIDDALKHGN